MLFVEIGHSVTGNTRKATSGYTRVKEHYQFVSFLKRKNHTHKMSRPTVRDLENARFSFVLMFFLELPCPYFLVLLYHSLVSNLLYIWFCAKNRGESCLIEISVLGLRGGEGLV